MNSNYDITVSVFSSYVKAGEESALALNVNSKSKVQERLSIMGILGGGGSSVNFDRLLGKFLKCYGIKYSPRKVVRPNDHDELKPWIGNTGGLRF